MAFLQTNSLCNPPLSGADNELLFHMQETHYRISRIILFICIIILWSLSYAMQVVPGPPIFHYQRRDNERKY